MPLCCLIFGQHRRFLTLLQMYPGQTIAWQGSPLPGQFLVGGPATVKQMCRQFAHCPVGISGSRYPLALEKLEGPACDPHISRNLHSYGGVGT